MPTAPGSLFSRDARRTPPAAWTLTVRRLSSFGMRRQCGPTAPHGDLSGSGSLSTSRVCRAARSPEGPSK
eukprot:scaffold93040_cov78-Phaeocystis_antarctica.AAC.2